MRLAGRRLMIALGSLVLLEIGCRAIMRLGCRASAERPRPGAFELYMVGESTPAGEPYDASLAPPQLVSRMFGGRLAGRPISVVNLARRAQSIYPQEMALRQALCCRDARNPGAVLIYSGNNDDGTRLEKPLRERALQFLEGPSRAMDALLFLVWKASGAGSSLPSYEFHLRRIIEMSLSSGLTPILSTVPSNVVGIDPALPFTDDLPQVTRAMLEKGDRIRASGRCGEALAYFRSLSRERPSLRGYIRYKQAECLSCLGRYREARALFLSCLSAPSQPDYFMRATPAQNDLLRRLAAEYRIPLADSEALFQAASVHGLIGDELFADGHHPNIKGHLLIDQAYAQALAGAFSEPIPRPILYGPRVLEDLGVDRHRQAQAFLDSGWWLLCAASGQIYPDRRLAMAQARFESALTLEPDDFKALSGLAIIRAGPNLLDRAEFRWLNREHLIWGGSVSRDSLEAFLEKLERAGVPDGLIARIRRSRQGIPRGKAP